MSSPINHLPNFPAVRPFDISDKSWIDEYTRQFPPYADFDFSNACNWLNQNSDLAFSQLSGNLVLSCTNRYMRGQHMLTTLGSCDPAATFKGLFTYQKENNEDQILLGVPSFMAQPILEDPQFNVQDDPDNAEYIISTTKLGELSGGDMAKIRQMRNQFEVKIGDTVKIETLDLTDEDVVKYLLNNLDGWEKAFATNSTAWQEKDVVVSTLAHASITGHKNLSFTVRDKLIGFALYHQTHDSTAIISHLKSSYRYPHTSFFMIHKLARFLSDTGVEYMNIEQDLGIKGLRQFKRSLRPIKMLEKCNIIPSVS